VEKRWKGGRGDTGYYKLALIEWPFMDAYILKYPAGAYLPPHRDPLFVADHYRCNLVLQHADEGGQFICNRMILKVWRLAIFRSDEATHEVTRVTRGTRVVLSLGLAV